MSGIVKSYLVPGLPHLVFGNGAWKRLQEAYETAGTQARSVNPDVLVIYSAQWISVLGHSFQANPHPKGIHVDENWYDMGDFEFSFTTDADLTHRAEACARNKGLATKLVNYEGFPIDTGSLVVLKYFNPDNRIPVVIVSSNIYCGPEDSRKLGEAVGEAIEQSGKKAILINCSSLSHRFFTHDIQPAEDKISKPEDDQWNQRMLGLLAEGKTEEAISLASEYAKAAAPEMMFKGFHWMMGAMRTPAVPANVLAYGPIWGTGAAVVEYSLN